jgi:hypothetical protein
MSGTQLKQPLNMARPSQWMQVKKYFKDKEKEGISKHDK